MNLKVFSSYVFAVIIAVGFNSNVFAQTSGAEREAVDQFKKAERAYNAGNFKEAKKRLEASVKLNPAMVSAWTKLASIYYFEADYKKAEQTAQSGLANNPGTASLLMWRGISRQLMGLVEEGTKDLLDAVRKKSDLFLAYYEPSKKIGIAKYYQRKKKWKKALEAYKKFLKYRPSSISKEVDHVVLFNIGSLYLKLNQPSSALKYCTDSLNISSRYPSAQWCKGEALRGLGRYSEALPYFKRVARYAGKKPKIFIGMAVSLFYSGNAVAAIKNVKRYLAFRASDYKGHLLLADLLYLRGQKKAAIRSYKRALSLNPEYLPGYIKLGITQMRFGNIVNAISTFKSANQKWPGKIEIIIPYAYALIKDEKFQDAYKLLLPFEDKENSPEYLSVLGLAALKSKQYQKAYIVLKKALKKRSNHGQTKQALIESIVLNAYDFVKKQSYARAEKMLSEAYSLKPEDMNIIRNIAIVRIMNHDYKGAKKILDKGQKILSDDFFILRLLGRVYLEEKQYKKAIDLLSKAKQKAMQRSSEIQAMVEIDLGSAYAALGDNENAVETFKSAHSNALTNKKLDERIKQNIVRSLIARAASRITSGKGQQALSDLKEISEYEVKLTPSEEKQIAFLKAMTYVEMTKWSESARLIRKLSKKGSLADLFKPEFASFGPTLLKAYVSYRQGNLDRARSGFRSVLKKVPAKMKNVLRAFIVSCDTLQASQYVKKGKYSLALKYFAMIPKGMLDVQSRLNKGLAYYKSGKIAKAIEIWKNLGTPRAACNLGAHYHNTGKSRLSYEYFKKCAAAGLGGKDVKHKLAVKARIFGFK